MVRNLTRETRLAERAWVASSLPWRLRGMIGRRFGEFDALIFEHTNSIHMFFMGMALDVVFLDAKDQVIGLRRELRPWRLAAKWSSRRVIELPAGMIASSRTELGDVLELDPCARV